MTGFQSTIKNQPAPAVAGDFASLNPRASLLGSAGQWNSPDGGAVVGRFVWVNPTTGLVAQSYIEGGQIGFLKRGNNAVITEYLGESVFTVYEGLPLDLFDQGDFWARFAGTATPGQRVWADPGTGAPVAGGSSAPALDSYTAVAGGAFTIAIDTNVATVSSVTAGWVDAGTVVTSAGITAVALGARLTGTVGGAGTFTMTHADVTAEAATGANTRLTVTAISAGTINPGDTVGSPATAGTQIVSQVSGTPGGVGLYIIDIAQYFASATIGGAAVSTPWFVNSVAAAGELAKISTWG